MLEPTTGCMSIGLGNNSAGNLGKSFGKDGKVITCIGAEEEPGGGVANSRTQPDSKRRQRQLHPLFVSHLHLSSPDPVLLHLGYIAATNENR